MQYKYFCINKNKNIYNLSQNKKQKGFSIMNEDLIDNIFTFLFSIIFKKEQYNKCQTLLNIKHKINDKKTKQKISILKHLSKKFG